MTERKINAGEAMAAVSKSFASLISRPMPFLEIEEWKLPDGAPFRIYVRPLSFSEWSQIRAAHDAGKLAAEVVETILLRSRNADGSRIFQDAQRRELRTEGGWETYRRIFRFFQEFDEEEAAVQKKAAPAPTEEPSSS